MIYAFIVDRCADVPVDAAYRAMRVSRSAFYAWGHAQTNPTPRMLADRDLGDLVAKIHNQSFGTYGWRRMTAELRLGLGRAMNHKRVERCNPLDRAADLLHFGPHVLRDNPIGKSEPRRCSVRVADRP